MIVNRINTDINEQNNKIVILAFRRKYYNEAVAREAKGWERLKGVPQGLEFSVQ